MQQYIFREDAILFYEFLAHFHELSNATWQKRNISGEQAKRSESRGIERPLMKDTTRRRDSCFHPTIRFPSPSFCFDRIPAVRDAAAAKTT